ncbi:DNA internalization-related competence protein ComEC/Rec2 [bacterium]|nr:DNA internalization-related competence protein ComEC/Rec2 [bacterium]
MSRQYPALISAMCFASGIIVFKTTFQTTSYLLWPIIIAAGIFLLLMIVYKNQKRICLIFTYLFIFSLGFMRIIQITNHKPANHICHLINDTHSIAFHGWVESEPEHKDSYSSWTFCLDSVMIADTPQAASGKIKISCKDSPANIQYGRCYWIAGDPKYFSGSRNPGGFDQQAYYDRKNISMKMHVHSFAIHPGNPHIYGNFIKRRLTIPLRSKIRSHFNLYCSKKVAPMLNALVAGDRSELVWEERESFAKAGIIHILAVSGLHVGLLLLILQTITSIIPVNRFIKTAIILSGLIFYLLLTNGQTSVTRAVIMASLYVLGKLFERSISSLNLLGFAALIYLAIHPADLFAPGFQLSFSAVLGLLALYPAMKKRLSIHFPKLFKYKISRIITEAIIISFSAQLATLPFVAHHFNRIPIFSIPLNIIAVPWIGLILPLTLTGLFFSIILPGIGSYYTVLANFMMTCLMDLSDFVSGLKASSYYIHTLSPFLWTAYLCTLMLCIFPLKKRAQFFTIVIMLLCLNLWIWPQTYRPSPPHIQWIQFDVAQGDAALLTLPSGKHLLIDGGDCNEYMDCGERIILPYLRWKGIKKLHAVFISHAHQDHLGGLLSVIGQIPVEAVYCSTLPHNDKNVIELYKLLEKKNIPLHNILQQDTLHFSGVNIELYPPDIARDKTSNASLAMRVVFGNQAVGFTGDLESIGEKVLLDQSQFYCQAIKVAHHGAATSSTLNLIKEARASKAIISVGNRNKFGHPNSEILNRWKNAGATIFRTDRDRALIFNIQADTIVQQYWQ